MVGNKRLLCPLLIGGFKARMNRGNEVLLERTYEVLSREFVVIGFGERSV